MNSKKNMTQRGIMFPDELWEQVLKVSKEKGINASAFIRMIVSDYLKELKKND